MNTEIVTKEKTDVKLGFFYSLGEVGSQLSWYMINSYLTLFYTDVVGLSAAAISLIMLIARVWDAVNDPMMGLIADRTNTRWGKFRPYLMFAPPFLAIFNILTFTVFPVQGALKVALCLICYIGAGMMYTVLGVSYAGLVNRIARDSRVRTNYAVARSIGSSVISMFLSAAAMPMILHFSNSETANAKGYFITTIILSVLMLPSFWLCAWKCKETVVIHTAESTTAGAEKKSILKSMKTVVQNKMLVIIIFNTFMGAMANIARMSMLSYYVIYVVGSYTMIAPIYTTITLFQLIGSAAVPYLTKVLSKKNICLMLGFTSTISIVLIFLFGAQNTILIFVCSAVIGLGNSVGGVGTGMICDCIEYGDWKYGVRDEALPFAIVSFSVKLATAVTGSVGVLLLAATGYVAGAEQSASTLTGINVVVNLIPAVCMLFATLPLLLYKIDDKMMEKIVADLDKRNANKTEEK